VCRTVEMLKFIFVKRVLLIFILQMFTIIFSIFSDDTSREIQPSQLKRKHSEEINNQASKMSKIDDSPSLKCDVIKTDGNKNIGNNIRGILAYKKGLNDEERKVKNDEEKINNDDNLIEETEMDTNENEELTKNTEKINVKQLENSKGVASGLKTSLHGTIFQVLFKIIFSYLENY
jgi:hypothetical protein